MLQWLKSSIGQEHYDVPGLWLWMNRIAMMVDPECLKREDQSWERDRRALRLYSSATQWDIGQHLTRRLRQTTISLPLPKWGSEGVKQIRWIGPRPWCWRRWGTEWPRTGPAVDDYWKVHGTTTNNDGQIQWEEVDIYSEESWLTFSDRPCHQDLLYRDQFQIRMELSDTETRQTSWHSDGAHPE